MRLAALLFLLTACSHEPARLVGKEGDTQRLLEAEVGKHPGNDKARTALGFLLLKAGDKEGAREQLLAASKRNPKNAQALFGLATIDLEDERASDAEIELARAIKADPRFPNAHWVMGQLKEQKGSKAEALAQYKAYRALLPRSAPHYERELSEVDAKITALSGN